MYVLMYTDGIVPQHYAISHWETLEEFKEYLYDYMLDEDYDDDYEYGHYYLFDTERQITVLTL